jgi:putative acetyltransferase
MTQPHPPAAISVEPVDPLHPDAIGLLHAAAREMRVLYADLVDPSAPLPTNEVARPRSTYLLARVDGHPAGSAAIRPLEEDAAEVRRVYVLPEFRRLGLARILLGQLEQAANKLGYSTLRLETGNRQFPAMALYESCGYRRIPAFGEYVNDPTSICYEKRIREQD